MPKKKILKAASLAFFLFLPTLFVGCHLRKRKYKITGLPKVSAHKKGQYCLRLSGVECKQCAIAALKALTTVPGIRMAECVCPRKLYALAVFECTFDTTQKKLPIEHIQQRLSEQDFELADMRGCFTGKVKHVADQWKMELAGDQRVVMLQMSQPVMCAVQERLGKKDQSAKITLCGCFKPSTETIAVDYVVT